MKLGIVMDPIETIKIKKDTTFRLMLEAQNRNWPIYYMQPKDIYTRNSVPYATIQRIRVFDDPNHYFEWIEKPMEYALNDLDMIFMRKDPPFNMNYIYTTYLLEKAESQGVRIINRPQSIRDANEKLFIQWFPQCCTDTLVTTNYNKIQEFWQEQQDIVIKPLDGMGGKDVFHIPPQEQNLEEIYWRLSDHGQTPIMAQRFLPEIYQGDKRILMINGEPVPYGLARYPAKGEFRANLAAGGQGIGVELTDRDRWICQQVGPTLKEKGLFFVGLDVIGDYLTEINVTSPTCMQEIERAFQIDIAKQFFDAL